MSEQPQGKSASAGWKYLAAVLPVLYFLSVEPLCGATADKTGMPPQSVCLYAAPYSWLYEHTPLAGPMRWYARFYWSIIS